MSFEFVILAVPYMRRRDEAVGRAGSDPVRFQALMEELKVQMQFAEQLGYTGFCMTEQHLQVEGIETTTNPLFWDYFIAQHTERMRVGQLGMNLTAINPIQLAENLAMLDHFTQGRLFAGFSRGNTPRWTGTFGQHVNITSTESDKSEADQRNRRAFVENWRLVKALWTQETVAFDGEFWRVPDMEWTFGPTTEWSPDSVVDGRLKEIGIVPRPSQSPHPPVSAPFSYSRETAKVWAREGGKMMGMVSPDKEEFIPITIDVCLEEARRHGRQAVADDLLALGGHLLLGRNAKESQSLYNGFEELFNFAYNAAPYNVPMGRVWGESRQKVADDISRLHETYGITEFFLWHHVGYFEHDEEMAMLNEFAEAVIRPLSQP